MADESKQAPPMQQRKNEVYEALLTEIINALPAELAIENITKSITLEVPPKQELGDYAMPCFAFSKALKKSPMQVATDLEKNFSTIPFAVAKATGPYVNFFINHDYLAKLVLEKVATQKMCYGTLPLNNKVVLIESPSPNTNKPLHLGHMRNMLLGSSIKKLYQSQGYDAKIVNLVNDRGVHICKSMVAYQKWGEHQTPHSTKQKSDHFVGDYYVRFSKEVEKDLTLEEEAQKMLVEWEEDNTQIRMLWKTMNDWALTGFKETYNKLQFKIDKEYYESNLYLHGKEIITEGHEKGIFVNDEKGNIVANLESKGLGKKVLLRANGTSVYITQDIYLAKKRYEEYNFEKLIYVVGNEQEYHFKVLFEIYKMLGFSFGEQCYHFSYGMIELPEGKMKSRQGNVIDTDELVDQMIGLANEEVTSRYPELDEKERNIRAEKIAMAAIRFFFLKYDPLKNFVFNPKESLAFEGETGPYVLYAYARICSIFRKAIAEGLITDKYNSASQIAHIDFALLNTDADKKMMSLLSRYPEMLSDATLQMRPSTVAYYLLELATGFSEYYRDNPILKQEVGKELRSARLQLIDSIRTVLAAGLSILGIDALEQM